MRYWDASAIVPVFVAEEQSNLVRRWMDEDHAVITWAWTRVEVASAIERRVRESVYTREERQDAFARANEHAAEWSEVSDLMAVRKRALALLARHSLRAADAAQLAAALVVAEDDPASLVFVCLDERLAVAAEREGFPVLAVGDGGKAGEE